MTRYEKLFGTPEQAAATLIELNLDQNDWCFSDNFSGNTVMGTDSPRCKKCVCSYVDEYELCILPDEQTLLSWLMQEAD